MHPRLQEGLRTLPPGLVSVVECALLILLGLGGYRSRCLKREVIDTTLGSVLLLPENVRDRLRLLLVHLMEEFGLQVLVQGHLEQVREHHPEVGRQVLDVSLDIVKVSLPDLCPDPFDHVLESVVSFLREHHRLEILEFNRSLLAYFDIFLSYNRGSLSRLEVQVFHTEVQLVPQRFCAAETARF